ncbi:hypothetical protein SKAU_G00004510 [Synaphobranchus kaupii]|uniref:Uncharacterized protein n=1 Tax=Synaphobranchus kaupii TaxID=118154 RepID=A0A9Q1G9R0_SYNKA|nr:hypothetical protein SKAU_G00004510 [Synaphobranchus kaupii]
MENGNTMDCHPNHFLSAVATPSGAQTLATTSTPNNHGRTVATAAAATPEPNNLLRFIRLVSDSFSHMKPGPISPAFHPLLRP